ncbi:MAG TPA: hypothetical protein VG347_00750 [Verrucomicrobiae bacterium]|nr:hypothetical protein [Verrucomicrobiae bacterium]
MSAPKKLRAGPESELTKLKAKWRGLSDDARSFWSELFVSDISQADIRSQLLKKLQVNLRFDKQLNAFRQWAEMQAILDLEAEQQANDEERIREEFGEDWTLDQIREEVIKRSYKRAIATGDWTSGRKTIVQDLNVKKIALDENKFKEGLRTKLESGLASLAEHIKGSAAAQAAFEAFEKTIAESTK